MFKLLLALSLCVVVVVNEEISLDVEPIANLFVIKS